MTTDRVRLKRTLRTMTLLGSLGAAALVAIPAASNGLSAASTASTTSTTSSTAVTTSSTTAPTSSSVPVAGSTVLPDGDLTGQGYVVAGTEYSISFACPAELATDGKITTVSITLENVDKTFKVLKTYDLAKDGDVKFEVAGKLVNVSATWNLPSGVKAGTRLDARVACSGTIDRDDKKTFKDLLTMVVNPINKFVVANFPAEKKPGEEIRFQVVCERSAAAGSLYINDKNGKAVVQTDDNFGTDVLGIVSRKSTATGFEVVAKLPKDLAGGDYTVKLGCTSLTGDAIDPFSPELPSELNFSKPLPLKVVGKTIPPTN